MKRCPKCDHILYHLTITHPWRLYCPKCKVEIEVKDEICGHCDTPLLKEGEKLARKEAEIRGIFKELKKYKANVSGLNLHFIFSPEEYEAFEAKYLKGGG